MKQKVIFFDADGTIVDGDYMSPDTKQTLIQLAEKGHILVLSTGRAAHQFGQALKQMEFENVISSG